MESLAESGTKVPGFRGRVMVEIDRLGQLSTEMRRALPASVEEANEILNQKDSIINLAQMEAQRIKDAARQQVDSITMAAQQEHESKVGENEIVRAAEEKGLGMLDESQREAQQIAQDAQRKAYKIIDEADSAANARRDGADRYAREALFNLEERMAEVLGQVRRGIDALGVDMETLETKVPA